MWRIMSIRMPTWTSVGADKVSADLDATAKGRITVLASVTVCYQMFILSLIVKGK
jgi:hypothetical protein